MERYAAARCSWSAWAPTPALAMSAFECADGYYESIDMPTALHPQTLMAFRLSDEILPRKYGYPFKIRMPTKLGFKNPKWVTDDLRDQPLAGRVLARSRLQLVQRI